MTAHSLYLRLFSLFTLWMMLSCKEEHSTSKPFSETNKATYEVINFCLSSQDITKNNKLVTDILYPIMPGPFDPVEISKERKSLTPEDIAFISRQATNGVRMKLDAEEMSGIRLIPSDEINMSYQKHRDNEEMEKFWSETEKKYGNGYLSFPSLSFQKISKLLL